MASYGNTVLTSAGIDLVKCVIAKTATFEITRVATSSDSRLTNATVSAIEAMTSLPSVNQTGKVTAFDTSNSKQVGIKCEFTNQGLTNSYNICGVGIYAKEAGKNEILFAVAPAKEPETMPAKPNDQSALFAFSLNMYVVVGQASAMSITATTEGVIKSINGTIKPDANGNVTMSYYSQAEVDQKISSLSSRIDSLNSSKTNNTDFNVLRNRVADNESSKADKTSVYDKGTADDRYLQRDASTTLKSGSVLIWDDSGHANDGNNVPYTAGGLKWTGKTDNVEVRAEETGVDNLDLVFNLGDDGSNNVDFRWNNVSKAKINSSGKFTGHVDWANVDGKDTYSRSEIDSKINTAKSEASARSDQAQNDVNALSSKVTNMQHDVASVKDTVSNIRVGDRNLARGYASSKDWGVFQGFNGFENYCQDLVAYQLDTLKAGDTVTFGITMKNEGVTSGTMIFHQRGDVSLWNRDYGVIIPGSNVTDFVPNGAEKTLTYTIPITAGMLDENSIYTIAVRTDNVPAGGKLSFRYAFVKKGTLATDWTPAPEDTDQAISKLSQAANAAEQKAEANASSIQAMSYKVDGLNSTKADTTSVKATADSLTASIANAQGDIGTLQHRADSITSTLSKGGVNLLSNTREINDSSLWSNLSLWDKGDFYNDGVNKCQIVQTSTQKWNGLKQYIYVEAGRKYTFSIDAKSGDNGNHTALFYSTLSYAQEGPYNRAEAIGNNQNFTYTPTWTRFSFTITATTNGYVAPRIERGTTTNELLQLARPQFEYGEIATPWKPSNGDIGNLQQTASELQSDLTSAKGAISSLDAKMPQAAYVPVVLGGRTDLNDMKTCGFYLVQGETINNPVDGWVYVTVQGIPFRLAQFVWKDIDPAQQWCRWYDGSNWTPWTHYTKAL